jgi:lysophospholipase L1-like esterase
VAKLQKEYPDLLFLNEGVDGEMSTSILRRTPQVVHRIRRARLPKVVAALVMVGDNDVIASESIGWAWFYAFFINRIWSRPTPTECAQNLGSILATLNRSFPGCKMAVMANPPLAECRDDNVNRVMELYNRKMEEVASSSPDTTFVDFYATCWQHLDAASADSPSSSPKAGAAAAVGKLKHRKWPGYSFLYSMHLLAKSTVARRVLRKPWDLVGKMNGFKLHVDGIHMNDTAAKLLCKDLQPFVEARAREAAAAPASS